MNELNKILRTGILKNPLFLILFCIGFVYIVYKLIISFKKEKIETNNKECLYIKKSFMTENEKKILF